MIDGSDVHGRYIYMLVKIKVNALGSCMYVLQ